MDAEIRHEHAINESEQQHFSAYLKQAREEVKTWPSWKQNVLGRPKGQPDREDPQPSELNDS